MACRDAGLVHEFSQLDTDGDGFLSMDELFYGLQKRRWEQDEISELFTRLDIDGDGRISLEEFLAESGNRRGALVVAEPAIRRGGAAADPGALSFEEKFNSAFDLAQNLLGSSEWNAAVEETEGERLARRAGLIKRAGGPELRLLHWEKIYELRRIPRSNEGHTVSVEEAQEICKRTGRKLIPRVLSHRWASPDHGKPDDDANSKACAVVRFSKYGKDVYQAEEFWWIDYACVNQDDPATGIAFLPTYIASGEGVTCFDHLFSDEPVDDYFYRPWCRVEIMTSLVYCTPRLWFYDPHPKEGPKSDMKPTKDSGFFYVRDPLEEAVVHNLTNPKDLYAIQRLRDVAVASYPTAWAALKDDHRGWNKGDLDFQDNKAYFWRMENYVRYQKLDENGWIVEA